MSKKKKTPQKKQKSFFKRTKNLLLYSIVMILIGFFAAKYQTEILEFTLGNGSSFFNSNRSKASDSNSYKAENALAKSNSEIVQHTYYSLGYNEDREQADWVAYILNKDMVMNKKAKRKDNFRPDPHVSTGSAELSDYKGSGYDRGHLCPAADMAFDNIAIDESFYMSNMSPQVPEFNRGTWKKLEAKIREWAKKHDEIYIVTGPVYLPDKKQKEIGKNRVDLPDAYYKVILDYREPNIKSIGFFMPNKKLQQPIYAYSVPVNKIETATGIDFFSFLPDHMEEIIEGQVNYRVW